MTKQFDIVDAVALAMFASAGVAEALWGFWMMLSLVYLPIGVVFIVFGLLSWYVAKGLLSPDEVTWWLGLVTSIFFTVVAFTDVHLPLVGPEAAVAVTALLIVYLGVRRRRIVLVRPSA